MATEGNQKIGIKTKISHNEKHTPYEQDLQKPTDIQDEDNLTDSDQLISDTEIVNNLLLKIKIFKKVSKAKKIEKNLLILQWEIMNDFFDLIEKYEKILIDKDLLILKNGIELFLHTIDDIYQIDSSIIIDIDVNYSKEIFYMYFKLFNIVLIQNYLKNEYISDYSHIPFSYLIARICYIMNCAMIVKDICSADIQRPINTIELLSLIINYIKTDFQSFNFNLNSLVIDKSSPKYQCLVFLRNYSNQTVLVPNLIEVGCSNIIVNIFIIICNSSTINIYSDLSSIILGILYNISRHDDGAKQLNDLNMIEFLKLFPTKSDIHSLNLTCCIIWALLATPEQIRKDSEHMTGILDTSFDMIHETVTLSNYRHHVGFHLSELLIILVKLFSDDHAIEYIIENSPVHLRRTPPIEFFIDLFLTYYSTISNEDRHKPATCTALVNILWSISFQDKYKHILKNANEQFKQLIRKCASKTEVKSSSYQYVPQYIENIHKAAKGLLFNIEELSDLVEPKQVNSVSISSDNNEKPMIMISYSHEDIDFCKQLYDEINKRGYDIWIDFKFLKTGDLWEQIAAGMKRAQVILCLMSEDYCKSKSCRWEATYALDKLQTQKSVIPVLLKKHELPDWLDIRISMLKYVRFLDLKQLENDKLFELMTAIEDALPRNVLQINLSSDLLIIPTHNETSAVPMTKINDLPKHHDKSTIFFSTIENPSRDLEKPIEQWTKNDISQWFQDNQVRLEFEDLCNFKDGYELLEYRKIFLETKKLQYQMYSDEFVNPDGITAGQRPLLLHEFTKFSNALRKLEQFMKRSS